MTSVHHYIQWILFCLDFLVYSPAISSSSTFFSSCTCHSMNFQLSPIGKQSKRWYLQRVLFQAADLYICLCRHLIPQGPNDHQYPIIQSRKRGFSLDSFPLSLLHLFVCLDLSTSCTSLKSVCPSPLLPFLSYSRPPLLLNFCQELLKPVFLLALLPPTVHFARMLSFKTNLIYFST